MPAVQADVVVQGAPGQESRGTLQFKVKSRALKTLHALLWILVCWALSAASIFVPVLHFALVPGFFFAGIALALLTFFKIGDVQESELNCPACGRKITAPKSLYRKQFYEKCEGCAQHLFVEINAFKA